MCRTLTAVAALSFFESSDGFFDLSAFEGSTVLTFDDLALGGMSEGSKRLPEVTQSEGCSQRNLWPGNMLGLIKPYKVVRTSHADEKRAERVRRRLKEHSP